MPSFIERNGDVTEVEEEFCPDCGELADFYDNAFHCDYCNVEIFTWHGPSGAFWDGCDLRNPDNPNELMMCV